MLKVRRLPAWILCAAVVFSACGTKSPPAQERRDADRDSQPATSPPAQERRDADQNPERRDANGDSQPATGCRPTTAVDWSCNDDPGLPGAAGTCQPDGTCACEAGFVLNPSSKRCRPNVVADAGPLFCTVGADQTCAEDGNVSTKAGICVGGLACACNAGFSLNPATGRCRAMAPVDARVADSAPGVVCTMTNQTCSDVGVSNLAGTCTREGTCRCNNGYAINPATGRCRPGSPPDAAITTPVCTPGADQTCNENAAISEALGTCQSDGTCSCRVGSTASGGIIITNARSRRCDLLKVQLDGSAGPAFDARTIPDARTGVCTPGQDQTCNESPIASANAGTCRDDGTCRCNFGYHNNPATGRCAVDPRDSGRPDIVDAAYPKAVCSPGKDMTCNDDPLATVPWGVCQEHGICSCKSGFVINANTGKCAQPTASVCTGIYHACGCACCMGTPRVLCYYANWGESLSAIKAADEQIMRSPGCAVAGCTNGQLYQCCVESVVEPAGSAQYSARLYGNSGSSYVYLNKAKEDGDCASIILDSTGLPLEYEKPFAVTKPAGWRVLLVGSSFPDGPTCIKGGEGEGIGAQGTVTFNRNGDSCTISAHLTLFYFDFGITGLTRKRIDADNIPITDSIASELCP